MNDTEIKKALQDTLKKPSAMNFNHVVLQKLALKSRPPRREYLGSGSIVAGLFLSTLGFGFSYFLPVSGESVVVLNLITAAIPLAFIAFNLMAKQIHHINQNNH